LGGGFYYALHVGILAGGVIAEAIEAGNFSSEFLQKYHELWWKDVGEGLMRSLRVKEIIEQLSDDDLNKIAKFMQGMKFGEIDIKEASSIVTQFPPEFAEFVQSLL
jgi:flavin-dependent dehydrogenase